MAVDQENVSKILSVLSHPLRREILSILHEKGESSFTDLMNALKIDTGKLSFHIRNLSGLIDQTSSGKYNLTKLGENAFKVLKDVEVLASEVEVIRKTSPLSLSSFRKRTVAFTIDLFLAFAIFYALPLATAPGQWRPDVFFSDVTRNLLFLILFWAYFTLLEGFAGQSLGKLIAGIKVVTIDGKKPLYDHVAVRNFGKVFLLPVDLLVGYLKLKDVRFIRYFDKFAGTTVVDLRF